MQINSKASTTLICMAEHYVLSNKAYTIIYHLQCIHNLIIYAQKSVYLVFFFKEHFFMLLIKQQILPSGKLPNIIILECCVMRQCKCQKIQMIFCCENIEIIAYFPSIRIQVTDMYIKCQLLVLLKIYLFNLFHILRKFRTHIKFLLAYAFVLYTYSIVNNFYYTQFENVGV